MSEKPALQSIKTKPSEELRFPSKRLSCTFPVVDSSLDVYYQESPIGVPFLWESRPGTPKIKSREFSIPPLTPPPSFHATSISRKPLRNNNLIHGVFVTKTSLGKARFEHSPCKFTPSLTSSPRISVDSRFCSRIEEDECESPVSIMCFRGGRSAGSRSRSCSSGIVRLLLGEIS